MFRYPPAIDFFIFFVYLTKFGWICVLAENCPDCGPYCISAMVPTPVIGECIDIFQIPQQLRVCVDNQSDANERVLPIISKLSVSDLSAYSSTSIAYTNQQCRLRWQDWAVPPAFIFNCYGGNQDMQPCKGLDDYFTCTFGTCVHLSDRPDWPVGVSSVAIHQSNQN